MNIYEFRSTVVSYINEHYEGMTVADCETIKNNGVRLIGITIKHGNETILPTLYLNQFLEDYNNKTSLEIIVKRILELDESSRKQQFPDMDFFASYEKVKDKICLKLINTDKNRGLLKDIPNRQFLDLSIVGYCDLSNVLNMNATVLIKNDYLKKWDISEETFFSTAYMNTKRAGVRISDLYDVVKGHLPVNEGMRAEETTEKMYVLTSKKLNFGAICMIFDDCLDRLIKSDWKGIYIIPSSIHEVLIIPDTGKFEDFDFNGMIKEVNSSVLSKEEVLAENAYYYSINDGYSIV